MTGASGGAQCALQWGAAHDVRVQEELHLQVRPGSDACTVVHACHHANYGWHDNAHRRCEVSSQNLHSQTDDR